MQAGILHFTNRLIMDFRKSTLGLTVFGQLVLCLFLHMVSAEGPYMGRGGDDEQRLLTALFDNGKYHPLIRPSTNDSHRTMVQFGVALIQLISIDEKTQIMKTNLWLRMYWNDYRLQWHKAEYGDIKKIRVPISMVWSPDIVLVNNADGHYEVTYKSNVLVSSEGQVVYIPPTIYKSSCSIEVKWFPFDIQKCEIVFSSWTYSGDEVDFDPMNRRNGQPHVNLNDYVLSAVWDVIDAPGKVCHLPRVGKQKSEAQLVFTLYLRRKTLFYVTTLIIPCVLIAFLTVCVFYLPVDAGEKITLSVSLLFALVVFLLLLEKRLPPTSDDLPLIADFLVFAFVLNNVSIISTVIIIGWSFRAPANTTLPRWVRRIFLDFLPRLLFMKRPEKSAQRATIVANETQRHTKQDLIIQRTRNFSVQLARAMGNEVNVKPINPAICTCDLNNVSNSLKSRTAPTTAFPNNFPGPYRRRYSSSEGKYTTTETSDSEEQQVKRSVTHKTSKRIVYISNRMLNSERKKAVTEDWKYMSMVVDRLLLIIFFVVTTGGTAYIILWNPNLIPSIDQQDIIARYSDLET